MMAFEFIRSSNVSNNGTTLNLFLIWASFCKNETVTMSEIDEVIEMTYAPRHSSGCLEIVLKVDQTSLFSLFLNSKLVNKFLFFLI